MLVSVARPAMAAAPPLCTVTATGLNFGSYRGNAAAVAYTGTVRVLCASGTATFSIALTGGLSGRITARQAEFGAARLNYQLYTNAAHTQVWGDGTEGSVVGPITASSAVVTVYGLVFAGQKAPPGSYTDAVQAILTY